MTHETVLKYELGLYKATDMFLADADSTKAA